MFSTYVTFIRCGVSTSGLEIVSDDDLVETIKVDNLVIVLFCKLCFSYNLFNNQINS